MEKYNISYSDIGRLEVGTETIVDKAKSTKTVLMQLFEESGNFDVEGIDTTNACYGGTNAVFNSINWVESSAWDGRYALVVAADIAVYSVGPARPTGGCAAMAILIGKDAPIVFDQGLRATHMEHVYDFYKADLTSEYPIVDGALTIECYLRSLDECYAKYQKKHLLKTGSPVTIEDFDYSLFHCPYTKQVQKSYGRLAFNDFLNNPDHEKYAELQEFREKNLKDTYLDKLVEKAFINSAKASYAQKVVPSIYVSERVGNAYTASAYMCLASLLSVTPSEELVNKRISVFSYGSGSAGSMFSLTIKGDVSKIAATLNLKERLESRTIVPAEEYSKIMELREKSHKAKDYTPEESADVLFPGTYYLTHIDDKFRRSYNRVPIASTPISQ
jgi:hydroxymethylglutaryl-CoA synthase